VELDEGVVDPARVVMTAVGSMDVAVGSEFPHPVRTSRTNSSRTAFPMSFSIVSSSL
jgi:hypothetical protein